MHATEIKIDELYKDARRCAKLVGLAYNVTSGPGFGRKRRGTGFAYTDDTGRIITDQLVKQRLTQLAIPPAWKEVWICPQENGHILATGIDERGRKQYIYHSSWRKVRDLLKFYRLIMFGSVLPAVRRNVQRDLSAPTLSRKNVLACMAWILDNTYIRIGNDVYLHENGSIGLTTLTDNNAVVAGPVVTLSFKGKSGKDHTIAFDNEKIAEIIAKSKALKGNKLFQYKGEHQEVHALTATDLNSYLHETAGQSISAKDFRTWGGTLMAFNYLTEQKKKTKKPAKIAQESVDAAANVLGNTRAIAKSSYIHPHLLEVYTNGTFKNYRKRIKVSSKKFLSKKESELLEFLKVLFEAEFDLLKAKDYLY